PKPPLTLENKIPSDGQGRVAHRRGSRCYTTILRVVIPSKPPCIRKVALGQEIRYPARRSLLKRRSLLPSLIRRNIEARVSTPGTRVRQVPPSLALSNSRLWYGHRFQQ